MKGRSAGGGSHWPHARGQESRDRYRDLVEYLSSAERMALQDLGDRLTQHRVAPVQRVRLVALGLAKLSHGELVLTGAGRHALAAILGLSDRP